MKINVGHRIIDILGVPTEVYSSFDVNVLKSFTPTYNRAIKSVPMLNGSTYMSDRGVESDKYTTQITIVGDNDDMFDLAEKILIEKKQITIECDKEYIFGPGLDYSSPITCNIINEVVKFPMRDVLTTTIPLTLEIVSAVTYDPILSSLLPTIYYKFPVARQTTMNKHSYSSMSQGDYGTTVLLNSSNEPSKRKQADFQSFHTQQEMGELQKFVSNQRANTFTWTTNEVLPMFDNPVLDVDVYNYQVKILNFDFQPNGLLHWVSNITLIEL